MNFSHKSLILLFLVSSILFACKNESKVGLDVLPQGQHIDTYMEDTFSVDLTTILPDSVNTTYPYSIWVGSVNDANFGKISATTYSQLNITSENYVFPTDAVYDSLTFTFKYTNIKYGDSTNDFTLNIHQLNDEIYKDTTYYNNSKIEYNSTPIGSKTFSLKHNENEIFKNIDSVSIKLDDVLGASLVSNLAELKTQTTFNSFFKGIAFVAANNNTSLIAGSLKADTIINNITYNRTSRMVLHYHSASANPQKALRYEFPIYNTSTIKFTNFTSDRTGTPISGIVKANDSLSTLNTSAAYLQSGSGLKVKLTLPNLKKLKDKIGDFAINKAELILPNTGVSNQTTFKAPSLFMMQANANGTAKLSSSNAIQYVQQDGVSITSTSNTLLINYDYTKNQYKIVITDYLQALVYDKVSPYYILIPASTGAENFVIGSKNHPTAPIKLRVHYSTIQ